MSMNAKFLMQIGHHLWTDTYKIGKTDTEASTTCVNFAKFGEEKFPQLDKASPENRRLGMAMNASLYAFAAKWAHCGYPSIVTDHKFARALMCTKIEPEFANDIHVPGDAFLVQIPNDILISQDKKFQWTTIVVARFDYGAMFLLMDDDLGNFQWIWGNSDIGFGVIFKDGDDIPFDAGNETVHNRKNVLLARRLVAGLLLAMNDQCNFRTKSFPAKTKHGRNEPEHRVAFVGRPISVDCKKEIESFLSSNQDSSHGMPSVQVLVRGHHKRQVVGIHRSGRRIIWVQPYWRGPEDAPILVRPHRIGGVK